MHDWRFSISDMIRQSYYSVNYTILKTLLELRHDLPAVWGTAVSVPSGWRTLAIMAGLLFPPAAVTTDLLDNIEEPCKNTQREDIGQIKQVSRLPAELVCGKFRDAKRLTAFRLWFLCIVTKVSTTWMKSFAQYPTLLIIICKLYPHGHTAITGHKILQLYINIWTDSFHESLSLNPVVCGHRISPVLSW